MSVTSTLYLNMDLLYYIHVLHWVKVYTLSNASVSFSRMVSFSTVKFCS